MSDASQQLAKAYELILRNQVDDAYAIIQPITIAEPDNTDAWWLLANATDDPSTARRALIRVLKLNPAHPKARTLLNQLNEVHPPRDDELMQMMSIEDVDSSAIDTSAAFVDDADDDFFSTIGDSDDSIGTISPTPRPKPPSEIDDLFADVEEEDDPFGELLRDDDDLELGELKPEKPRARRRRVFLFLTLLLLLLCLVGLVVVLGGGSDPEPIAEEWTTVTAEVLSAESSTDLEQTRDAVQISAESGLGSSAVESYYVQLSDSTYALVVDICAAPNPVLPRVVQQSMDFIARDVANRSLLEAHIAQVGLVIRDCALPEDILYRVLAPWQAARDYSAAIGDSSAFSNFRQTWQVDS